MDSPIPAHLVVFSDDWARHPSSCQHLVRQLLPRHPALWVNTIGTRRPTLTVADAKRAVGKIAKWLKPADADASVALPQNLRVIGPRMYPGFRSPWQRRFNASRLTRAVNIALGPRPGPGSENQHRICLTTLPITADLVGQIDVDRWVYYCVDDFSVWPGLDAQVMIDMEKKLVAHVDALAVVSASLQQRLSDMGRSSTLITHGIDLAHWSPQSAEPAPPEPPEASVAKDSGGDFFAGLPRPIYAFWGLIDRRLDTAWCQALLAAGSGTLALIGPVQSPDPALVSGTGKPKMMGPIPYEQLPDAARQADVLVMPYADLPVTRAMQPLKFKEYLATGKPVVARALPALADWRAAADLVDTQEAFLAAVRKRAKAGIDEPQRQARQRLAHESWEQKAQDLEKILESKSKH